MLITNSNFVGSNRGWPHDLFAENARVNGFQDDSRCDAIEETENFLAGVWDTEAFLYAFEVETPQIISRAAHALQDGKCFSRGNPPGLLYEQVPGPMLRHRPSFGIPRNR